MALTVVGTRHVISAGHYLAAHAGFQVLEAGGNAVPAEFAGLLRKEHTKWAKVVKDSGARVD